MHSNRETEAASGLSLPLPKLTLGTAQLGMPDYGIANDTGGADTCALLEGSVSAGITSFDTSPEYGESEKVIGEFLALSNRAQEMAVMTKVKLPRQLGMTEKEVAAHMYASLEGSLSRLQLRKLPVLKLHDPDILVTHGETVTRTLRSMRSEGLIAAGGISLTDRTDEQYRRIAAFLEDDIYAFVQAPLNLLDHRLQASGAMQRMQATGKTIVARSVYLQGLLLMNPERLPNNLQEAAPALHSLRLLAEQEGISVAQLAFSYVRDMDGVASLIIGIEKQAQLEENLRLLQGPALSERCLHAIRTQLGHIPERIITPALWNRNGSGNRGTIPAASADTSETSK
ncbi:aldo/keto reductase [Paenibacillus sp. J5C_2022]|uniref:aldo/keto reductase n=1 Tax=Paenibacillus sp. J5C2022 TaxID=2977129 RepID=UPI0021CF03E5|nr:aldo/keto reductase [Paenibacillus sp. J5C2022]MCU6712625.1 aldo/keto reductase [Paenibacillus sp. J5C2022]